MTRIITNDRGDGPSGAVVYRTAGVRRALPLAVVRAFGLAGPVWPVPFAGAGFEGLSEESGELAPQFDLSLAMGGAVGGGRYVLTVDAGAGPLRLRVEAVAVAAGAEELDSGWPEIAVLAAGLAPADPAATVPTAAADEAAGEMVQVLIVRSAGIPVALPASAVARVERHRGIRPGRRGGAGECVVALDGDILPGWSLAHRQEAGAAEEEGWAVVTGAAGEAAALTVAEVCGLTAVARGRLRRLRRGGLSSVWLPDPGYGAFSGMIELLDPGEITGAGGDALASLVGGPDGLGFDRDEPPERRASERGRLVVAFGPFACVVPGSIVGEVLAGLGERPVLPRRGRGAVPLVDAAALLGLPRSDAAGWMLRLNRSGRRGPLVRVPALAPAAAEPAWRPLPMLPPPAHRLFSAVRPGRTGCEFLLRETVLDRPRDPVIAGLVRAAPAGWLGGF